MLTRRDAALVLRGLVRREVWWRERVGDEDYERAVSHWRALAEGQPTARDDMSGR